VNVNVLGYVWSVLNVRVCDMFRAYFFSH